MASIPTDPPDHSEIIMVAQLSSIHGVPQEENAIDPNINIAGGTSANEVLNDMNHHSHLPVPAMEDGALALPAVLAVNATTTGNSTPEVMAMDGDTLSMSSPFTSPSPVQPVREAKKRGSPAATPRGSRAPSPTARWSSRESSPARFVGPTRAVHRRVELGSEDGPTGTAGRFVQLDAQARLDHEYMDNLSMDLEGVMNLTASNELSVKWLRKTVEKQAKDMVTMQIMTVVNDVAVI